MALYNDSKYLTQSSDDAFTKDFKPGEQPVHSGIYRCPGCGREVVAEEKKQLPPQNHHQHTAAQGLVRWRMIVYADHQTK
jgi:hypothetical protein